MIFITRAFIILKKYFICTYISSSNQSYKGKLKLSIFRNKKRTPNISCCHQKVLVFLILLYFFSKATYQAFNFQGICVKKIIKCFNQNDLIKLTCLQAEWILSKRSKLLILTTKHYYFILYFNRSWVPSSKRMISIRWYNLPLH